MGLIKEYITILQHDIYRYKNKDVHMYIMEYIYVFMCVLPVCTF